MTVRIFQFVKRGFWKSFILVRREMTFSTLVITKAIQLQRTIFNDVFLKKHQWQIIVSYSQSSSPCVQLIEVVVFGLQ